MAPATTIPDLTEDQIDQLLSAAEKALPAAKAAVKPKQQSLALAATAPPAAQPAVDSADKDVTLRVPQPRLKEKKVCISAPPNPHPSSL